MSIWLETLHPGGAMAWRGPSDAALLWIENVAARNALTPEMLAEFGMHIRTIAKSGARALVIAGKGAAFSSGFDLRRCPADPAAMTILLTRLSSVIESLRSLDIPVVVAAHGAAVAGACAMFGGADLVVTDQAAKLGYPVTRLGLSPAVSSPFLTHQVSGSWLRRLMLDPGLISGAEAAAIGLAHVCVPTPEEVLPAALAAASELAEKPPGAIAATKAWLREIEAWKSSSGHAARGLAVSVATGEAPESRERIAALKFG